MRAQGIRSFLFRPRIIAVFVVLLCCAVAALLLREELRTSAQQARFFNRIAGESNSPSTPAPANPYVSRKKPRSMKDWGIPTCRAF